jgi:diacylglycerol kinase family enzyme
MPRAFVLLTSRAGGADHDALHAALSRGLSDHPDWSWELVVRGDDDKRRPMCRDAVDAGFDLLVAAGGDGTVCRVGDVGVERDVPIGILPMGTGNLVARELGVPLDLDDAVAALRDGVETQVDCLDIGDRRLVSKISVGAYAQMAEAVGADDKRRLGRLAYVRALAQQLVAAPECQLQLTVDGCCSEVSATAVFVANVGSTGVGELRWGEGIDPCDGVADVLLFTPRSGVELAGLVATSLMGATESHGAVHHLRAERCVELQLADDDAPVRGDGKVVATGAVVVQVRGGALRCRLPRR